MHEKATARVDDGPRAGGRRDLAIRGGDGGDHVVHEAAHLVAAEPSDDRDVRLTAINVASHRGIARGSGNLVLGQVVDSLPALSAREQLEIQRLSDGEVHHAEHLASLDAVRAADATAAEVRMLAGLEGVRVAASPRARPTAEGALCDHLEELT